MERSDPAPHPTAWTGRAAGVAAALALAAAVEIALERWIFPPAVPGGLLRGRVLPALLWVAAVPFVMRMGARFPLRGARAGRDALVHAATFAAWLAATNLLLRLPDASRLGWAWVLDDTLRGMVRYAPTAVLLWLVLAWLGRATPEAAAGVGDAATDDEGMQAKATPADGAPAEATPSERERPEPDPPAALPVPGLNRVHLVALERIRWLEADGDHVRVHTTEGEHRMRATLSQVERRLAASRAFVRIHRSHLVNLAHLREVQPFQHGDWVAVMSDGAELRIPRTRRRALERILGEGEGA